MSAVGELASIVSSRKKGGTKEKHPDNKQALVFMLPWLLGLLGITLIPMIASFALAFTDYSLLA
ncbi:MAG: ABC transporter permease, partial [Brachybacterium sp.]